MSSAAQSKGLDVRWPPSVCFIQTPPLQLLYPVGLVYISSLLDFSLHTGGELISFCIRACVYLSV